MRRRHRASIPAPFSSPLHDRLPLTDYAHTSLSLPLLRPFFGATLRTSRGPRGEGEREKERGGGGRGGRGYSGLRRRIGGRGMEMKPLLLLPGSSLPPARVCGSEEGEGVSRIRSWNGLFQGSEKRRSRVGKKGKWATQKRSPSPYLGGEFAGMLNSPGEIVRRRHLSNPAPSSSTTDPPTAVTRISHRGRKKREAKKEVPFKRVPSADSPIVFPPPEASHRAGGGKCCGGGGKEVLKRRRKGGKDSGAQKIWGGERGRMARSRKQPQKVKADLDPFRK